MMKKTSAAAASSSSSYFFFLIFLVIFYLSCFGSAVSVRPDPGQAAPFARWMIGQGSWGVLTTLNAAKQPFGNVMSYTDPGAGVPYFYLTTKFDPTGANALADAHSCLTLSEIDLGTCDPAVVDPQSPMCAKITLSGLLKRLPPNSNETMAAEAALFAAHPQFQGFPKIMGFEVFKLEIQEIFLVNLFRPYRLVPVDEYFAVM